ncbi:MAG: VCBS repeat-containing protein [Prevotella sp.]|nr:VCBS repeat-containing protein [Prevotella sp.]
MRKRFLAGMLSLLAAFPIEVYSQDRLDGTAAVTPTGGASYTVQIQAPKGYGDLKPSIALTYNSQSGNGIAGWGCSITGISAITRGMKNYLYGETPKGIKYSTSDALYLDGKRLIKVSGTEGSDGSVYSPEGEPLTKVTLHGSSISTSSWLEVDTNDGMTYEFGHATGTQQTTRVASAQRPFAWYISKCTNNLGQTITYQYQTSDKYLYPQTISYGGGNTVDFEYEARTDTITFTLNGLKGYVGKRLKSVSTKAGGNVFRIYKMTYDTTSDACTTKYSRLTYITETGTTGNSSRQIKVDWNNLPSFSPSCATFGITPPQDDNLHEYGERYLMAGDLNGDGVSDIVHVAPVKEYAYHYANASSYHPYTYAHIYRSSMSNGNASYLPPLLCRFPAGFSIGDWTFQKGSFCMTDIDGDGINDLILPGSDNANSNGKYSFYFSYALGKNIVHGSTGYSQMGFMLSHATEMPLYAITDLDHDGKSDVLVLERQHTNGKYLCHVAHIGASEHIYDISLTMTGKPRKLFTGDYNGDGITDMLVICDDGYRIFYGQGGIVSANTFTDSSALFPISAVHHRIEQGDFNGDGILDFVWNDHYSNKLYFSLGNGNGTFTKRLAYTLPVKILPKNTDKGTWNCLVTDLDRDGKSDVVINMAAYNPLGGFQKTFTLWLLSNGSSLTLKKSASSKKESDAKAGHICVGDFMGKGRFDVLNYGYNCWGGNNADESPAMYRYGTSRQSISDGKVKSVKNSDGRITSFTYGSLTSDKLYTKGSGSVYPLIDVAAPLCVVSQMRESGASPVSRQTDYTYKELRAHLKGRGILGFTEQKASEYYTGSTTTARVTGWNTMYYVPRSTSTTTTQGGFTTTSVSESDVAGFGYNYMSFPLSLTEKDIYGNVTTTTFSYNTSKGYLTKKRTEFGGSNMYRQTEYTYSANKIGKAYRPETVKQTQKHSDSGQAYSTTTKYTYAANGLPSKVVEHSGTPMALTKEYVYDTYGNTTKETVSGASMSTMVTNFQYSGGKFLLQRSTTPASSTVYYGLNPFGEVMARIDMTYAGPSSQPLITNYTYNGFGMMTKETKPTGEETTYSRTVNSNGYTITVSKAGGGTVTTKYDALDNELSSETKGVGGTVIKTTNTYSNKGLLTTRTHKKGNLTITESMSYDALGRMIQHTSSSGTSASYTYGNRTTTTTDHGREYIKTYDAWGNVTESTDPAASVSYVYHSNGKPSSVESEGATVYMDYDEAGNQTFLDDPDAGTSEYEYDALGRVIRQTDARGNETTFTYDATGKLTARNCGGVVTSYTYGTSGYDKERLVREQTGDRIINYTYNNKGLLSSETRSMTGETPVTFTYQYDDKGRLSSKTYPQGVPVNYRYDAYGNLVGSDIGGRCVSLVTGDNGLSTTVVYGGTLPSGSLQVQSPLMTHTSTCDSRGYLTELRLAKTGNISLRSMLFSFDGATGNLRNRLGMTSQAEDFEYDDLDRLVGVKLNSAVSQEVDYADNGNISSKTGLGGLYYGGPKPHAVTSIDNPQGRVSTATQQTIYTPFGKVESISENGYSMLFTYGPDEERWKTEFRQNGIVMRSTFYAGDYERVCQNGITQHFFYLDNGCIYVMYEGLASGSNYYYAFTDHLGSVTRIFNESGTSVFEAEYDAWGKQTVSKNTIGFHRGYTGHEMLPEFGLINMNGRLYDPILGRFLSPDNFVQMPDFSQSFNRYAYCVNNPLKYNDPDGELWWLAAALIGGAINVAMNIDNIDNGWDFLGYFGVGAAAGALGGGVANAVAGAIGISGFAGGAVSGFAGGLSSGFVLGGGNSLMTNGNFDGFFENAATGALVGGVTGAVVGGIVGGYSAYKQGNNFWTGEPIDAPNWGQEVYTKSGTGDRNYMEISYDEIKPDPEKVVNEVMHSPQTPLGGGTNSVYLGYDEVGNVRYVGITERTPELRFAEHLNSGTERALLHYETIENAQGLSRIQARIIEQRFINIYGMQKFNGMLYNKINSISPRYWNRWGLINK